jgi:protein-tyrosine-phosphatase
MAERLFRAAASTEHQARSAGARPGRETHPEVVEVLRELGIDASDHVPHQLDEELLAWADIVVATCDGACPVTPGKRRFDWHIRDPIYQPLADVRAIREEIQARVAELVGELESVGFTKTSGRAE